jgi:hypothetical protein
VSKFRTSQVGFALVLGLVLTSGSVASWSQGGGFLPEVVSLNSQDVESPENSVEDPSMPTSSPTPESESETSEGQSSVTASSASPNPSAQPIRQSLATRSADDRLANLVLDPNAGGSPEVVYPHPSEREQTVATKAPAPTNFRVTALGDNFVSLAFTTSPSVSLYQAYIRHNDSYTLKGVGSSGVVTFRDLGADFDYVACVYYQVNGVDSNLACLNIHTTGTRPAEPVKAPAPTNIQLSATETTVTASWDAVPGAQWYRLCHVSGLSSWQCGGYTMLGQTQAVFQDGSISKATRYGITVEAVMADGNSGERAIRYITTPGTLPPPPTKYAAPTNLRITAISTSEFTAAWDYPEGTPVTLWSFAVRQLTSYSNMGVTGSARTFTFRDLQPANGYEIILKGMDDNGLWTEEVRLGFYSPAN